MSRILGILAIVFVLYGLILASNPAASSLQNHQRLAERLAWYGILTIGAGILITSGGIDLSIGSVFCLSAVFFTLLLNAYVPAPLAILLVLLMGAAIGLFHGTLVTKLKLQPFVVTLCGLFIWRGLAYWLTLPDPMAPVRGIIRFVTLGNVYGDQPITRGSASNVGIGARIDDIQGLINLGSGYPETSIEYLNVLPWRFWLLALVAAVVTVVLHFSVYGRYLFAVGANEQAARYAGIPTDRYKISAYVVCSMCAALAGMIQLLELKTVSPSSSGNFYELYAITGAVLGGCSLRGGEGTVLGMVLGAAVLPLLRNLCNFSGIPDDLEFMVIGVFLLLGTVADEFLKRRAAARG